MKNFVSIIIPTYNEENDIGKCLSSLEKQSYKNKEIIIVDDGSLDSTLKIVKTFKKVQVIEGEHKGPGFSRNLGAKRAKGGILVFIDSDMTFDKSYIKNLVFPILKKRDIIGTTHDYELVKNTSNIWSRCWGKVRVSKEEAKDVKIFRAIRKDKFFEFGGFDPKYGYADDQTFWFKYKIKPEVAENTLCYHKNPETLKQVYKQSRWIGASIDNILTNLPVISYFIPPLLFLISPFLIPILSIKKCYQHKDAQIILPMFLFMAARCIGSIEGIMRNIYLGLNVR